MFVQNQKIIIYDFDACSNGYPMMDVATICDATDYFSIDSDNFIEGKKKTMENLCVFQQGYSEYYKISEEERLAVLAGIGIRHFDIQATIIETLGINCVNHEFLEQQLKWLEEWCKVCGFSK